ncbi:MAG: porin family protein [Brumimicrobium sp.]
MKVNKILVLVGIMSIASTAISQEDDYREELRFGIKAGGNFSNVYDSQSDDFEADGKLGFAGGVALSIPIGKYFGIQPELLLSQKGFKGRGSFLGSDYSFKRTTTYIDIPLQFQLKPSRYVTILVGPQYSYLIKQKDEFNSDFIDSSDEDEFENDNIRRNMLGIVAGLDVNIQKFVFGARMGWDFQNNHGDGSSNTPRYKNVWLQGTVGFYF